MTKTTSKNASRAKTTNARAASKNSARKAPTMDNIKASKYINHSNIISICVLTSCLTAVLVTLIFNFGMKSWLATESSNRYDYEQQIDGVYSDAFANEVVEVKFDVNNFRKISSTAAIGMIKMNYSAIFYIEPADCNESCVDFREQLSYTQGQKASPIYAVYLGTTLSDDDRLLLSKFKIGVNDLPTLIYLKEGEVFDRLDSTDSIDGLRSFVQKYRNE